MPWRSLLAQPRVDRGGQRGEVLVGLQQGGFGGAAVAVAVLGGLVDRFDVALQGAGVGRGDQALAGAAAGDEQGGADAEQGGEQGPERGRAAAALARASGRRGHRH